MPQAEFAEAVGMATPTLSLLENSKRPHRLETLIKIAEVSKRSLDWLVARDWIAEDDFEPSQLPDIYYANPDDDPLAHLEPLLEADPTTINDALQKVKAARRQLEEAEELLEGLLMFSAATSPTQEPESTVDVNPELFDRERKKQRKKKNA